MNKDIKITGFRYADGTHWHYNDKEVAVINNRGEIEWCVRTFSLPEEVVEQIRNKVPRANGTWLIEAKRNRYSTTQGNINIFVNGKNTGISFYDKIELNQAGEWESTTPDNELGKFIYACLWPQLDANKDLANRFKDIFKPNWREELRKETHL